MPWFKVDDSFHSHPKTLATDPAALGLWVIAGAWSSANLTDGFVSTMVLSRLLPDSDELAKKLVAAGLWKRAKGGYQFHDWSDYQPNKNDVEKERKAARDRMRNLRANRKPPGHVVNGSPEQGANVRESFGRSSATPTHPVPSLIGGTSSSPTYGRAGASSEPPSPRCETHLDVDDPPPCGPCGDARRARSRWDLANAERLRNAPQCRIHRGQPAHNCGPCRADLLAAKEAS